MVFTDEEGCKRGVPISEREQKFHSTMAFVDRTIIYYNIFEIRLYESDVLDSVHS